MLFNNNFNFQILQSFSYPEGRFVMVDIRLESRILTLVNIYALNEDKPTFFQNVVNQLLCFDCSKIILGEDFNLVLDVQKDKKGGRQFFKRGQTHFRCIGSHSHLALPSRLFLDKL